LKVNRKIVSISNETTDQSEFVEADSATLFEMVWEITRDLWTFAGGNDAERRLQRDVVNIIRLDKDLLDVKMLKRQNSNK